MLGRGPRTSGEATALRAGQPAEWLPARLVLVGQQPDLRRRLEAAGAQVVDVREALARGDLGPAGDQAALTLNPERLRDPVLTTAAGAVVGRLRDDVRRPENAAAELVLRMLGVTPILRVEPPGFADGGDFLAAGQFALQGQGLLSDADGIGQLLDAGAYGDVEVAVVRDLRSQGLDIRLDSYVAIYGPELAGVCEDREGGERPEVDVYVPEPTMTGRRYRRTKTVRFLDYLRSKGMRVVAFTEEERDALASQGLAVGPMHYLAPSCAGDPFLSRLRDRGVTVEALPLAAPGGGPRGATQVLVRSAEPA